MFTKIIMHHTGGPFTATQLDINAYHTITQGDGTTVLGKHPREANAIGRRLVAGQYAAHTLHLNSGTIGKAVACMGQGVWAYPKDSKFFPRPSQMDSFLLQVAIDAKKYGIPINGKTVLSHAEVEPTLGVKQRNKWDFDYDPYGVYGTRNPIDIGDMLREKIVRLTIQSETVQGVSPVIQQPGTNLFWPVMKQGSTGPYVAHLQAALQKAGYKLAIDSQFGPTTRRAVIDLQRRNQLDPDGIVGQATRAVLQAL